MYATISTTENVACSKWRNGYSWVRGTAVPLHFNQHHMPVWFTSVVDCLLGYEQSHWIVNYTVTMAVLLAENVISSPVALGSGLTKLCVMNVIMVKFWNSEIFQEYQGFDINILSITYNQSVITTVMRKDSSIITVTSYWLEK
jgi:hypothetical protein